MSNAKNPRFKTDAPEGAAPVKHVDPASMNVSPEWNETLSKLNLTPVFVELKYSQCVIDQTGFETELGAELTKADLGHFDARKPGDPFRLDFYVHTKALAAGLQFIKAKLKKLGILNSCKIGYMDQADKICRVFYPTPAKPAASKP